VIAHAWKTDTTPIYAVTFQHSQVFADVDVAGHIDEINADGIVEERAEQSMIGQGGARRP